MKFIQHLLCFSYPIEREPFLVSLAKIQLQYCCCYIDASFVPKPPSTENKVNRVQCRQWNNQTIKGIQLFIFFMIVKNISRIDSVSETRPLICRTSVTVILTEGRRIKCFGVGTQNNKRKERTTLFVLLISI